MDRKQLTDLRRTVGRLETLIRSLKAELLPKLRKAGPVIAPACWQRCGEAYESIVRAEPRLTLKQIHARLMEQKARNKKLAKLPTSPATFGRYVNDYLRSQGLPPHRQRKRAPASGSDI